MERMGCHALMARAGTLEEGCSLFFHFFSLKYRLVLIWRNSAVS